MTPADAALAVVDAARGVRYKTKALREALKEFDEAVKARAEKAERDRLCTHPRATYKAGANVGNYDPSADRYWRDYDCPDCGKRWTVTQ